MLDQYEMKEKLGEGGNGVVFHAIHRISQRPVAIKMLADSLLSDDRSLQRFHSEAKITCALDHPNIVKVLSFGISSENGSKPFVVMEFIEGKTLSEILQREQRLNLDRFQSVFSQVCSALQYAHSQGIVHRDIKPSNIMVVQEEHEWIVKLVDFGVARREVQEGQAAGEKITKTGALVGSPIYMSPEQCKGAAVDNRSDIYSLACIMYEAICGRPPFIAENPMTVLMSHINEMPPPMEQFLPKNTWLPPSLLQLITTCLEKDPAQRLQNASDLEQALGKCCAEELEAIKTRSQIRGLLENRSILIGFLIFVLIAAASIFAFQAQLAKNETAKNNLNLKDPFWRETERLQIKAESLHREGHAHFLESAKTYKEAIEKLKKFLQTHPGPDDERRAKRKLFNYTNHFARYSVEAKGYDRNELQNRRDALEAGKEILSKDSLELAEAQFDLARMLGRNRKASLQDLDEAYQLLIASNDIYKRKIVATQNASPEDAAEANSDLHINYSLLGLVCEKKGDPKQAISWCLKAQELKLVPGDAKYEEAIVCQERLVRAYCEANEKSKETESRKRLFAMTEANPDNFATKLLFLGDLFDFYADRNHLSEAKEVFAQIRKIMPTDAGPVLKARLVCHDARLDLMTGKRESALRSLERAEELLRPCSIRESNPILVWNLLRETYKGIGEDEKARACVATIIKLEK